MPTNTPPAAAPVPFAKPLSTPRAPKAAPKKQATAPRKYDVVLYGATGFVGRQTVDYFAKLPASTQKQLRWALAGRSKAKLEAAKAACGAGAAHADVIVADALDTASLDKLARSTAVVLSTAGPFAIFGSELLAACARNGTHYVDITGETPWVHTMLQRHQAEAQKTGACIIPFCGFDSVPSDLGAFLMTQAMQTQYGEDCVSVKSAVTMRGGVNGGTLASAMNMLGSDAVTQFEQPYLLNPPGTRPQDTSLDADPVMPVNDPDYRAWLVPFVMGPINTRVVRRSAALLNYGADFHYQEYMRLGAGPLAAVAAAGFCAGMASSKFMVKVPGVRQLTEKLIPGPGKGPSEKAMDGGSYRCELVAKSSTGHVLRGRIADRGDPGNRATTKMVCEAALCLALSFDKLPPLAQTGGFLTPASGLGDVLVARLKAAGMTLRVDTAVA